jgi:UDP-glucose 4-epimerase
MKLFILGSSGFIGSRLVELFARKTAYEVIGYSSRECNLLLENSIQQALSGATAEDVIIIASAVVRLKENSYDAMIQNIQMVENIANYTAKHPVSQVIFLSTAEVYGALPADAVITERNMPCPNNYYSISKLIGEYLLNNRLVPHGIALTVFRLPGIYGPGGAGKSTINMMLSSAQKNKKIVIFGRGRQRRDYVYLDDIFTLAELAVRHKIDATLNVATGISYSIKEIGEIIISIVDSACSVEYLTADQSVEKTTQNITFDTDLLRTMMPGMAFTDLYKGISLTNSKNSSKT